MEMKVDTFNWPAMLLGAIDADFEVVSPSPPRASARLS